MTPEQGVQRLQYATPSPYNLLELAGGILKHEDLIECLSVTSEGFKRERGTLIIS